jgi:hypothetical protein
MSLRTAAARNHEIPDCKAILIPRLEMSFARRHELGERCNDAERARASRYFNDPPRLMLEKYRMAFLTPRSFFQSTPVTIDTIGKPARFGRLFCRQG